ncbi:MAG: rubrerythrin family protein [Elusimicrobiota bacterium]
MEKLEDSRTFENVRKVFAEEAALVFRYLYYATLAEFDGMEKHAALFKEIAEGGTANVHGCFDFLKLVRDPDSEIAVGGTFKNLESLVQSETKQFNQTYPEMAKTAREEGLTDIASWFETLEKAKRAHVQKLRTLPHE